MKIKEPRLNIGDVRGRWVIVDIITTKKETNHTPPRLRKTIRLLCRCECGEERLIPQKDLKPNRTLGCVNCYNLSKFNDLTGRQIGELTVVSLASNINNAARWKCLCACGKYTEVDGWRLLKRKITNCTKCNSYEEITAMYFHHLVSSSLKRGIEISITPKILWNLFLKQNKKCALTGIELTLWSSPKVYGTASLDRIDSTRGYTEDNIQWVHKSINLCKHVLNNEQFISMCNDVAKFSKSEYSPWYEESLYKYKKTAIARQNELAPAV